MHSQCYARCHSTLGARAYFFYVTKFLRIQCTRNSRDVYIYIYIYRDSASVESTRGGSLTLAPIIHVYIYIRAQLFRKRSNYERIAELFCVIT